MAFIKAVSYYLPERIVSNEDLVKEFPEWTTEKIANKIGVSERHLAANNETAGDMAVKAAEILFSEHDIDKKSIDYILLCTQSPDYFLPSTACIIQNRLGIPTTCGALDFNLGCSGYVYGLALAKGLIVGGIAQNVLLLTAETYNKYLHPHDKGNRTIFGDGASATLVSNEGFARIKEFSFGTDGKGASSLIVKTGASRYRRKKHDLSLDENGTLHSSDHLFMDGKAIFDFTAEAVPKMIDDVLSKNHLMKDDVDLFVFHQANKYMINYLRKLIGIEQSKFYICLEKIGNTISSSIPIALCEAQSEWLVHGNILLAGFGVGFSWGGCLLQVQ